MLDESKQNLKAAKIRVVNRLLQNDLSPAQKDLLLAYRDQLLAIADWANDGSSKWPDLPTQEQLDTARLNDPLMNWIRDNPVVFNVLKQTPQDIFNDFQGYDLSQLKNALGHIAVLVSLMLKREFKS